ncbi:MAG: hypothetical protein GXY89_03150 [Tissierellia bacterium]|nr:hypothetical protein [Tissierellia bacterium]
MGKFKFDKDFIYERSTKIGKIDTRGTIKDKSDRSLGKVSNNKIYDSRNKAIGEVRNGKITERGRTIGRVDDFEIDAFPRGKDAEMVACWHFLIEPIFED